MTLEEALTAKLAEVVGAAIGSGRVFPDAAPQPDAGDGPTGYLLYQAAGTEDQVYLSGGRSSTRVNTYQLEVWHPDRATLEVAREAIFAAFAGAVVARWGGPTGVWIQGAVASDAYAEAVPPADADEEPDRGERITLRITWTYGA